MPTIGVGDCLEFVGTASVTTLNAGREETCAMPYCITLRSRTDTRIITGWYADSPCPWSTDHDRQKLFDNKHDAREVCDQLRSLWPRNAEVINIEDAQDDLAREVGSAFTRSERAREPFEPRNE